MERWKKPLKVLSAGILISGVLFTSTVDASSVKKNLEAIYSNIKIINNSQSVEIDSKTEPFVVNGVTYVPLRMMGELFNKNVQWNGATSTITVTDKTTPISPETVASLNSQIATKDAKIAQLQTELNNLKTEKEKVVDLDDLEDELNNDYGDYSNISDVEIFLGGNKDKIDTRVDVDSRDWKKLTDSKKKAFLQEIIDDILSECKNADINGTVKDADNGDLLATFDINSSGDVKLENKEVNLDDLEDQLNDDYYDYDNIAGIDLTLSGDEDDITLTIEVENSDWTELTSNKKLDFLQDIVDDILDEFEDAEITGTVKDDDNGSKLNTFTADGNDDGDVEIN